MAVTTFGILTSVGSVKFSRATLPLAVDCINARSSPHTATTKHHHGSGDFVT
ncbi:MAG: hypothetical protein ACI814_002984, partial [Mariniblastus sp.]